MSIHLNRSKLNNARDNHEYTILFLKDEFPPYWDEGLNFYPRKVHCWAKSSGKKLESYKIRMYKTWKHNRKAQWKEKE